MSHLFYFFLFICNLFIYLYDFFFIAFFPCCAFVVYVLVSIMCLCVWGRGQSPLFKKKKFICVCVCVCVHTVRDKWELTTAAQQRPGVCAISSIKLGRLVALFGPVIAFDCSFYGDGFYLYCCA